MTLTREWCAMSTDDPAKPTREIVGNLVRIVARGGNYLLGIGPDETGRMVPSVVKGLAELGAWMEVCSEGIYDSVVPSNPPALSSLTDIPDAGAQLDWYLTEKEGRLYAFGLSGEDEVAASTLHVDRTVTSARVLGGGEVEVRPDERGQGSVLTLPASPTPYAIAVELHVA